MDRMHSKVVSALLLVAVTACSSGESAGDGTWAGSVVDSAGIAIVRNPDRGVWTAEQRWTVEEQLRIGAEEGDANLQFGQLVSLDLDSEGNIYTLDQMGQRVQVFDASGEYVRTLGRPGSGPGEFSQVASAVLVTPGDTITVPDLMLQRATRFTPEGEHATDFPLPMTEGIALKWVMSPDGRIVQQTREMPVPGNTDVPIGGGVLLTRDASGSIQDTLVALPSTETFTMEGNVPRLRMFSPEPLWTLLTDGRVVLATNDKYRVEMRSTEGSLTRIIQRQVEGGVVSEADKSTLLDRMREMMGQQGVPPEALQLILGNTEFADRYPVLSDLLGGPDGTLWVQRVRPANEMDFTGDGANAFDFGSRQWDVYDVEGRLLGAVELPPRFRPLHVEGDDIYGVQRDELDVQYVVRLRVLKPDA
ncbi:MAG TPA: 6-bladed beta-propeller [Gemmatimonadales bacterium]|nr:6-bladed beta-propeller [Gemmatimonadales bacterium]